MAWFINQGGTVDWSRLPTTKPPARSFFLDDDGHIRVEIVREQGEAGRFFDLFDREGRYLGEVELPFPLYGQ